MKNPFKVRHVNPALLFIQFLIILIYGIIAITNSYLAYGLTRYILSSVLFITGIARAADEYSKSKNILKTGITFTIFYTIALALFLPYLVVISVSMVFNYRNCTGYYNYSMCGSKFKRQSITFNFCISLFIFFIFLVIFRLG